VPRYRQCGARRRASRCRRSRSRRRSVDPAIDDEQLATLHAAGVRAVRFNFIKRLVEAAPKEASLRVAERVARLGWHVVVYFEASGLEELTPFLRALPTTVVVDHMGRPDVSKDVADAGFQRFVALFRDDDRFWVKVSCPERLTRTGPPYEDVVPFARALVERFPDRVLWGTDWPHPNMKSHMPDDGALVDFIPRIAPDTASRLALLVDNPLRLYWQ
jgi:2-pyrone-4,6-dicarboxylate lactonase